MEPLEGDTANRSVLPNACNAIQGQYWLGKIKRNWTSSLRSDEFSRFLFMVWGVVCWVVLIWGAYLLCVCEREKRTKRTEEQELLTLLFSGVHSGPPSQDQGLIFVCVVYQGLDVLDYEESPLSWRKTWLPFAELDLIVKCVISVSQNVIAKITR